MIEWPEDYPQSWDDWKEAWNQDVEDDEELEEPLVFEMSPEVFNKYWPEDDQRMFKLSHLLAGTSLFLPVFLSIMGYFHWKKYKEFMEFESQADKYSRRIFLLNVPLQVIAFPSFNMIPNFLLKKQYHGPNVFLGLIFADIYILTMLFSLLPNFRMRFSKRMETNYQCVNNLEKDNQKFVFLHEQTKEKFSVSV